MKTNFEVIKVRSSDKREKEPFFVDVCEPLKNNTFNLATHNEVSKNMYLVRDFKEPNMLFDKPLYRSEILWHILEISPNKESLVLLRKGDRK